MQTGHHALERHVLDAAVLVAVSVHDVVSRRAVRRVQAVRTRRGTGPHLLALEMGVRSLNKY